MLKNQKGITLVSLVITIVVLLILAGVAVSIVVTGQDSVIDHGKNAVTMWNDDVNTEKGDVQNALNYITKVPEY